MLVPKKLPKCPPRRPKNDSKTKKKTSRKKNLKKNVFCPDLASQMPPQDDPKTIKKRTKKQHEKRTQKKANIDEKTWPSCERKAAYANAFRYTKTFNYVSFRFILLKDICSKMLLIGRFWPLLGHFWLSFAPSWAAFGRSWPLLDGPGATHTHTFRRPKRHTYSHGRTIQNNQQSMPKMTDFDPQNPPKSLPRWPQNRTKKRSKIDAQNRWPKWRIWTSQSLPKWPQNRTKKRPKIDAKNEAKKEPK